MNEDKIKIYSFTVNNMWWCNTDQPVKVMGSPLKAGAINLFLSRKPEFVYERSWNLLYAVDNGFVSIYEDKPGTKEAFGGHKFDLKMKDGTTYTSNGNLWDPFNRKPFIEKLGFNICSIGITTDKEYRECPVFLCQLH